MVRIWNTRDAALFFQMKLILSSFFIIASVAVTRVFCEKIWFDTDIGGDMDDVFALGLLLKYRPEDVVGISTVNHNPLQKAKIAQWILERYGFADKIPVYAGIGYNQYRDEPSRFHRLNPWWSTSLGTAYQDMHRTLYEGQGKAYERFGVRQEQPRHDPFRAIKALQEAIKDAAKNGERLKIVATGPLNNLALLYQLDKTGFYADHSEIICMGGWYKFDDSSDPLNAKRSGYNWGVSPLAAQKVLDGGVKMLVFPSSLTFTKNFIVNDQEFEKHLLAGRRLKRLEELIDSGVDLSEEFTPMELEQVETAIAFWNDWQEWNQGEMEPKKLADPATVLLAMFPERIAQSVGVDVKFPIENGRFTREAADKDLNTSDGLLKVTPNPQSSVRIITEIDDGDMSMRNELMSIVDEMLLVESDLLLVADKFELN